MQVTENQIQRFFDQQCNAEEASTVAFYLQQHPEVIQDWLGPDWNQAEKEIPVPASYREEMLRKVFEQVDFNQRKIEALYFKRMIYAAAAVIIFLLSGWWFFSKEYSSNKTIGTSLAYKRNVPMEIRVNISDKPLALLLPDGSTVTMEPGATLKFEKEFTSNERKVFLTGNSFFDVKKDPTRPFTVVSGQITTTALGTSFRVIESNAGVTVKLFTGKVVVNKIGSTQNWSGPVYLLPGTLLTHSLKGSATTVSGFVPEKNNQSSEINFGTEKVENKKELLFDNTPLEEVLQQIEKNYLIQIQYDKIKIANHYFTGKVLATDSVEIILNVIGNMNDLVIKKETDKRFSITKTQ